MSFTFLWPNFQGISLKQTPCNFGVGPTKVSMNVPLILPSSGMLFLGSFLSTCTIVCGFYAYCQTSEIAPKRVFMAGLLT